MKNYFNHLVLNLKCAGYSVFHAVNHLLHGIIPFTPLNNNIHTNTGK